MSFISRLRSIWIKRHRTVKVTWIGLDHAGKTTIVKRISQGIFDDRTVRTLGMNVDEIESDGIKMLVWDLGGQITFRDALWVSYMSGSMGVIYVVDSSTPHRFDEAKKELWHYVLYNNEIENIPILVLANKQDLEGAASAGQVARALDLHRVTTHSYAIFPTSAKTGFNLEEALEWLRQRIIMHIEGKS